jgi:hypothetical protein
MLVLRNSGKVAIAGREQLVLFAMPLETLPPYHGAGLLYEMAKVSTRLRPTLSGLLWERVKMHPYQLEVHDIARIEEPDDFELQVRRQ